MARPPRIRFVASPVREDGTTMMGTHGSVRVDGHIVLAHVVFGVYASRANFLRFALLKSGTSGVTYRVERAMGIDWKVDGPDVKIPGPIPASSQKVPA